MKKNLFFIVSLSFLFISLSSLKADRRNFVWTYEYLTLPEHMTELEWYITNKTPDNNNSQNTTWEHEIELEYGLNEKSDIALYQRFKQSNTGTSSKFKYSGFKLRYRYKLNPIKKYNIKPLLYLEIKRDDNLSEPNEFEGKIILEKKVGDFLLAYNQIYEKPLKSDSKAENAYAFGAVYELKPDLTIALESKGNYTGGKYSAGPTIGYISDNFWVNFGILFGMNEKTDDITSRMIIGFPFM